MPYTTIDVTRQNGPADITAVQIHPRATEPITVINVYNPPPRWTEAGDEDNSESNFDLELLPTPQTAIICGDFNADGSWDPFQPEDRAGLEIDEWIVDMELTLLNDGAHTRVNPASGGQSVPDISLCIANLEVDWKTERGIGSDHLPILTKIAVGAPTEQRKGKGRFAFQKANWQKYQEILEEKCKNWIPSEKIGKEDKRLTEVLLQAAHASIPFGNGGKSRLPFWNEDCTEAVKERDEAQKRATAPRHSTKMSWHMWN
ncbi:uncharacterized protein LOC142353402 [Convolutriloba macropyga]|uniref:uncharacterized protein LOC142353402 n=1 Tax=Convolutriloba macropyga TaxID=536237 RepID=UPI003F51C869